MLFNSPGFLFVFPPLLLLVFFQLGQHQQRWAIAWLTLGSLARRRRAHYALFVSYHPHLIAGPLLHHKEMMPQFAQAASYRLRAEFLGVGLTPPGPARPVTGLSGGPGPWLLRLRPQLESRATQIRGHCRFGTAALCGTGRQLHWTALVPKPL